MGVGTMGGLQLEHSLNLGYAKRGSTSAGTMHRAQIAFFNWHMSTFFTTMQRKGDSSIASLHKTTKEEEKNDKHFLWLLFWQTSNDTWEFKTFSQEGLSTLYWRVNNFIWLLESNSAIHFQQIRKDFLWTSFQVGITTNKSKYSQNCPLFLFYFTDEY